MDESNQPAPQPNQEPLPPIPQPALPTEPTAPSPEPLIVTSTEPLTVPQVTGPQVVPQSPGQPVAEPSAPQPVFGGQIPQQPAATAQPTAQPTDTLGILSIVFFFIFQLVGLILGIIGMRKAKKQGYKNTLSLIGTIINGVSVAFITVLIIPLLVLTTMSGVQTKGKDTERQTDIRALHAQLESYYANHGYYPLLSEVNDANWRTTNMSGLDSSALSDPKDVTATQIKSSPMSGAYSYEVYEIDSFTLCTVAVKCMKYSLTATLDGTINGLSTYTKTSLN